MEEQKTQVTEEKVEVIIHYHWFTYVIAGICLLIVLAFLVFLIRYQDAQLLQMR